MTISPKSFRFLLLITILLNIGGYLTTNFTEKNLPLNLQTYILENRLCPMSQIDKLFLIIATPALMAFCLSYVGLFKIKKWGRTLFLTANCIGIFSAPLAGATVYSGTADMVSTILSVSIGLVIAIAYFTPLFDD